MPTKISAKIVADSVCPRGHRITSMVLVFPRYILAEFNTHRMLSRNSASSRAIPFKKMVHAVKSDPFIPLQWMKDHKGMQGNEFLKGFKAKLCSFFWILASRMAILMARILHMTGLTKQLCNRILEPFMWHSVLVTATEWDNFFFQRANKGADIHMQVLAHAMLDTMNSYIPVKKKEGEWHIPFQGEINDDLVIPLVSPDTNSEQSLWDAVEPLFIKIATAKAARISYTSVGQEQQEDYAADIKLHDKLWDYPHPSPFEHCAQVPTQYEYNANRVTTCIKYNVPVYHLGVFGNFYGWKQYRKMLPNENHRDDFRLVKNWSF